MAEGARKLRSKHIGNGRPGRECPACQEAEVEYLAAKLNRSGLATDLVGASPKRNDQGSVCRLTEELDLWRSFVPEALISYDAGNDVPDTLDAGRPAVRQLIATATVAAFGNGSVILSLLQDERERRENRSRLDSRIESDGELGNEGVAIAQLISHTQGWDWKQRRDIALRLPVTAIEPNEIRKLS